MNNNHKIIFGAIVALVAVGSFYAGTKYASAGRNNIRANFTRGAEVGMGLSAQTGQANIQRGARLGGAVGGEVISKDDKSITVKNPNGGSKLVFFSTSTEILKSVTGTIEDLSVGTQVSVQGTDNSDGSVTAKSVQIRPVAPIAK
jgi:hypothetical protein